MHVYIATLQHCKYSLLWQAQQDTHPGQENAAVNASNGVDAKSSFAANHPAVGVNVQANAAGYAANGIDHKVDSASVLSQCMGQQGLHNDCIAAGNQQQAWAVPGAPAYPDASPDDSPQVDAQQSTAPAPWQTNQTLLLVTGTPLQWPPDGYNETPAWLMQQPGAYKPTFGHQAGVDY